MTKKELETRLINLENAFLQSQQNTTLLVDKLDNTSVKIESQEQIININTEDISYNRDGLTETFEVASTNTDDISVCMDAITEIYEMIGG